jgi:hypothetical protein
MKRALFFALVTVSLFATLVGRLGGDEKPPEQLQPPPEMAPAPKVIHYAYPRVSRYDIWQYYGVGQYGRFRPLVINSPYGAYYLYNHEPFPWLATHNWEAMPYIVDSPAGQ